MNTSKKGFTLMEMLLVVAIIGILAAVTTANYGSARAKARDSERVTEVGQIALAMEMYYNACREYPDAPLALTANNGSCPTGVTLASFLDNIPQDPQGASYVYAVSGANDAFVVKATLETDDASLNDDADGSIQGEDCNDGPPRYYCEN